MELSGFKGVGRVRLAALSARGITSVRQLLKTLPVGYRDTDRVEDIAALQAGMEGCIEGVVSAAPKLHYVGRMSIVRAVLGDDTGSVTLNWFNQPWMAKNLRQGDRLRLWGRAQQVGGKVSIANPERVEKGGIHPRYPAIPGVPRKTLEDLIEQALPMLTDELPETLPERLLCEHGLMARADAYREAHRPTDMARLMLAQRRIGFEDLLLFQMAVRSMGGSRQKGIRFAVTEEMRAFFLNGLPFALTNAQLQVLDEVVGDLQSGLCMNRLIQGDVGSGKTVIALAAAYFAARNGWQTALMAPTEVLARQHHQTASFLLAPLGISAGLLVGGMKAKERREALDAIQSGRWQLVIGTHALIQDAVRYHRLGLVLTDEQHRFGVRQRRLLSDKGDGTPPHTMVLSATPIPRTLALILYGDLDVSTIGELPPGRTPVVTRIVPEAKRREMYRYMAEAVSRGEQAYYVCPLVEDSEETEAKSAQAMFEGLREGPFKALRVGLTYGAQKAEEKEETLRRFAAGDIDVLVATTVIEVGIDVPNATIMVIEDAERFGLSQLHQLRGRVGRGRKASWCFLMGEANERLRTLCATNDGFVIAQKDLDLRGPGEFLGTRQHGRLAPDGYGVADISLIEETRAAVDRLLTDTARIQEKKAVEAEAFARYADAMEHVAMN